MNALQWWEKLNKLLKGAISVIANGIFLLRMYADIENFAIRVADYFYEKGIYHVPMNIIELMTEQVLSELDQKNTYK